MLNLSENAGKELTAFFADKPKSDIRIYLAPGGCSGPRLGLALDEATDEDTVLEAGGYNFAINKELLDQVEGVDIDVSYMGFMVEPKKPLPSMGGGCSACGGSCGG